MGFLREKTGGISCYSSRFCRCEEDTLVAIDVERTEAKSRAGDAKTRCGEACNLHVLQHLDASEWT